jgi:DNA-binding CsgD family transcriptional regulator
MSNVVMEKKAGWFTGLIDGAARAFAFGGNGSVDSKLTARAGRSDRKAEKAGRKIDVRGLNLQVQRLAADGHTAAEIARRTALSQDTIALLLHLTPSTPDESAGQGTFFRVTRPHTSAG